MTFSFFFFPFLVRCFSYTLPMYLGALFMKFLLIKQININSFHGKMGGHIVCKVHDIKIWPRTFAFQKGSNIIVSPPPCLNLREYKRSEKKVIMSTPQSCTSLVRNIPLKISLRKLHMICHQSLFTTSNTKQFQKVALNG
jgi:hypothetical protein